MLHIVIQEEQPPTLQGRDVIEEAARLLRQLRFSTHRGASAEGQQVAVSVALHGNDDQETVRVLLTCYAFGHRQVAWQGLPVFVLPEGQGNVSALAFLNARGQAVLPRLERGAYRLSTSAQYGRSPTPIPLHGRSQRAGTAFRLRGRNLQRPATPSEEPVYTSIDGRVQATVRHTPAGTTVVAFETQDGAWAGATVRFALVDAGGGEVAHSAEVELQPVESPAPLWRGIWEQALELSVACNLVFAVLAKER